MNTNHVMLLAKGQSFDLDCYRTQLNNNVLIAGTPGSGKTRKIVTPNILQADGSYLIVDPKGDLYEKHADYLRFRGYQVRKINFAYPDDPDSRSFNFFDYIRNDQDILKIAHMLVKGDSNDRPQARKDPFWDESIELLLISLISYLYHHRPKEEQTLHSVLELLQKCEIIEDDDSSKNALDVLFEEVGRKNPDDYGYCTYQSFCQAADTTRMCILSVLSAKIAVFDTEEVCRILSRDTIDISSVGDRETAVFVIVSDTDRSMDMMVNVFFSLSINELCRVADRRKSHRLPLDVRFILDDFATNVRIADFPRIISSVRSRGISAMIIIQAESQLFKAYGPDARTIIGNCDTYVYLGGNDLETADSVAKRANVSLDEVLYMPVGKTWIFRRGQMPVRADAFELEPFLTEKMREMKRGTFTPCM